MKNDSSKEKELKIGSFFQTDIYNISKYIPLAYNSFETGDRNTEYNVVIENPELGIFNEMKVTVFQSTEVANVAFIAKKGRVNDSLQDFIKFLVERYGLDDNKKGYLTVSEVEYLQSGFGVTRYWINHGISLDLNVDATGEFEILFYGIKINNTPINNAYDILSQETSENDRVETTQQDGLETPHSLLQTLVERNEIEVNMEINVNEHTPLDKEKDSSARIWKRYVVYMVLLFLLLWFIIEFPWVLICIGIVVLIICSSGSSSGQNVKGHYKKNGTFVRSYNRRTRNH